MITVHYYAAQYPEEHNAVQMSDKRAWAFSQEVRNAQAASPDQEYHICNEVALLSLRYAVLMDILNPNNIKLFVHGKHGCTESHFNAFGNIMDNEANHVHYSFDPVEQILLAQIDKRRKINATKQKGER